MGRLLAFVAATVALAACQQTVRLYEDAGGAAKGGTGGNAGGQAGGKLGSGGSGLNDGGQPDGRCFGGSTTLAFTPDMPQMVIALDRSTSMNQTFPMSSMTHLGSAMHALYSEIGNYTRSIAFWFLDFPNTGKYCSQPQNCCAKDPIQIPSISSFDGATICDVPPAPAGTCVSTANRPVTAALANAEQAFATAAGGPRYIMLMTDGDPGTDCSPDDCMDALKLVPDLRAKGIRLFILAIAAGNQASCLFDLANAVNANTAPPYLMQAGSPADVTPDLQTGLLAAVCSGTVANPPQGSSGFDVRLGNSLITYSSADGWTVEPNGTRIRFHGNACAAYVGGATVQVTTACGSGHTGGGGPF